MASPTDAASPPPLPPLLTWGATQSHILTGGGRLAANFLPGRDFETPTDLPHTVKARGLDASREQYREWLATGRRDPDSGAVGAWCRPLFSGGWAHSSSADTQVFNLQTPSIFIDLRFPRARLSRPRGFYGATLEDCTNAQLRELSRQHCFAGYALVDRSKSNTASPSPPRSSPSIDDLPICTRHHALDWNYHARFPRSRPNKWRIEPHPSGDGSQFKEWGFATEPRNGQAIYMERWALLPDSRPSSTTKKGEFRSQHGSKGPWLALRAIDTDVDAFLVVVGDHFAFARDRVRSLPDFSYAKKGGCGSLADAALQRGDREALLALISLEGSYGHVSGEDKTKGCESLPLWEIECSTWPWREGCRLVEGAHTVWDSHSRLAAVEWDGVQWEVLENSFGRREVDWMFLGRDRNRARL